MSDDKAKELAALKELVGEEFDFYGSQEQDGFTFKHVDSVKHEGRRWSRKVNEYYLCETSGRYWEWSWEQGLTEIQEHDFECYGGPVEVTRHEEQVMTTKVTYKRVKGAV